MKKKKKIKKIKKRREERGKKKKLRNANIAISIITCSDRIRVVSVEQRIQGKIERSPSKRCSAHQARRISIFAAQLLQVSVKLYFWHGWMGHCTSRTLYCGRREPH